MSAPRGAAASTTRDRLLGGRIEIDQPARGYRVAVDPVLLAASVPARAGQRVLDLGTGVGTAALCLAARVPGCAVVGLDIQDDLVGLARGNIALNGMTPRIRVEIGSVAGPPAAIGDGYDHVMLNPPYMPTARSGTADEDLSRVEAEPLSVWLQCALARVRSKGMVSVIHRADRVDEVVSGLTGATGGLEIVPVWPKAGTEARRVIVRARRGMATPARISPGLVLHRADGEYSAEATAILRDAAPMSP